jgi:hypothetical protein
MEQTIVKKKGFKEKMQERWQVSGWWQMAVILFVFSITGSLSVIVSKPVLEFLGIEKETMSPYLFWPLRILVIFPVYQLLLITIGTLCGQFTFFWNMEKKMGHRIAAPFRRKRSR